MIIKLKQILKKGVSAPLTFLKRRNAKGTLTRLVSHKNPKLRAIGVALQEALDNNLSLQEQQAVSLIEERRSFLLNSDKEIAIVDYGAGSSSSKRTKEEMERGIKSTALVSKIATASKPKFWAIVLFKIIRELEPLSCVELGTCVGISASYQATALYMNGEGAIVTLEGSDEIAEIAKETFENLDVENASVVTGPFHETLTGVCESSKPIDFFFNDGHHDHDAVIRYFNLVMPYLSDTAVIVFDDISWSPSMRNAWAKIEEDECVAASIDLHDIGIALINKKGELAKERFEIFL